MEERKNSPPVKGFWDSDIFTYYAMLWLNYLCAVHKHKITYNLSLIGIYVELQIL